MVDVESGLKYPFRGEDVLKLHAIGGGAPVVLYGLTLLVAFASIVVPLLGIVQLLLVPLQLALGVLWTGYFVRVAKDTFDGGTEPPGFDDLGGLARDGVWGLVVVFAYYVPLIVVSVGGYVLLVVLLLGATFGVERGSETAVATAGVVGGLTLLVLFFLVLLLSLATAYLMPISLVAYADEGSLSAAFSLDTLKTVGRSSEYVKPWAAAFGVYMLLATVLGFLSIILVGYLLMPFAYFYVGTAAFHMFAQSYANTTGKTIPSSRTADEAVGTASAGGVGTRTPEDV